MAKPVSYGERALGLVFIERDMGTFVNLGELKNFCKFEIGCAFIK